MLVEVKRDLDVVDPECTVVEASSTKVTSEILSKLDRPSTLASKGRGRSQTHGEHPDVSLDLVSLVARSDLAIGKRTSFDDLLRVAVSELDVGATGDKQVSESAWAWKETDGSLDDRLPKPGRNDLALGRHGEHNAERKLVLSRVKTT